MITSFATNICLYSNNPYIGYTFISQELTVQLYGTTTLSLEGKTPKWIVCQDLFTNQYNQTYCKVAHGISYKFMETHINSYIFQEYKLKEIEKKNPYYKYIKKELPTLIYLEVAEDYRRKGYEQYAKSL